MDQANTRILVWDAPVRLFHALLAVGFFSAYGIAKILGEDSSAFPFHSMIGMTLVVMVLLRLVWGVVGTRWARFPSLSLNPAALFRYSRESFSRTGTRYTGHNPATSYVMLAMFALVLGMGWTGYQMGLGQEGLKGIHELMANGLLALAIIHIAGVVVYTVLKRDPIAMSMVDGHKTGAPGEAIQNQAWVAGSLFLVLVGFFFASMVSRFDPNTNSTTWPLVGTKLQLGESEGSEAAYGAAERESEEAEGE